MKSMGERNVFVSAWLSVNHCDVGAGASAGCLKGGGENLGEAYPIIVLNFLGYF